MKLTAQALIPTKKPKQNDWIDKVVGCARAATVVKVELLSVFFFKPTSTSPLRG